MNTTSTKLTIEILRTAGAITIQSTLVDQTNAPLTLAAVTLVAGRDDAYRINEATTATLGGMILERCEDLGWRDLSSEQRRNLSDYNGHAAMSCILRQLLVPVNHEHDEKPAAGG